MVGLAPPRKKRYNTQSCSTLLQNYYFNNNLLNIKLFSVYWLRTVFELEPKYKRLAHSLSTLEWFKSRSQLAPFCKWKTRMQPAWRSKENTQSQFEVAASAPNCEQSAKRVRGKPAGESGWDYDYSPSGTNFVTLLENCEFRSGGGGGETWCNKCPSIHSAPSFDSQPKSM